MLCQGDSGGGLVLHPNGLGQRKKAALIGVFSASSAFTKKENKIPHNSLCVFAALIAAAFYEDMASTPCLPTLEVKK